ELATLATFWDAEGRPSPCQTHFDRLTTESTKRNGRDHFSTPEALDSSTPPPHEGRPAAAAERPYQQLFRVPAGTGHLRTGHDLPGWQAGDAARQDTAAAREHLQRALAHDPHHPQALELWNTLAPDR